MFCASGSSDTDSTVHSLARSCSSFCTPRIVATVVLLAVRLVAATSESNLTTASTPVVMMSAAMMTSTSDMPRSFDRTCVASPAMSFMQRNIASRMPRSVGIHFAPASHIASWSCGNVEGREGSRDLLPDRRICDLTEGRRSGNRQRHLKACATTSEAGGAHATVVRDDDLLHEREAKAGSRLLRREERSENLLAGLRGNPRAVVPDRDSDDIRCVVDRTFDLHVRRHAVPLTGLDGVAQQVHERLTQQHIVGFDAPELTADGDITAQLARLWLEVDAHPLDDGAELVCRQGQLRRPREVQEVRDHLSEGVGLLTNTLDVRRKLRRQRRRVEQFPVPVNRREAVAEFVRDARRELAEFGERVLETQLLLEIDDRGDVREQADDAAIGPGRRAQRGDGYAHMGDRSGMRHFERASHDRLPGCQTLGDR